MKRLAKILVLILISILILGVSGKVEASSFKFDAIAEKEEVNAGDTVKIDLKVSEINAGEEGINVVEGILEYDDSIFESIKLENENDWNMTYNGEIGEKNGKFLVTKMVKGVTQEEKIGQIQLQLKQGIEETETEIKVKEIKSNDGKELIDEGNRTIKIKVIKSDIKEPTPEKPTPEEPKEPTENKKRPVEVVYVSDEEKSYPDGEKDYPYEGKGSIIADGVKTGDIVIFIIIAVIAIITVNIIYFTMKGKELKGKYRKSIIISIIVSIILMLIVVLLSKDVIAIENEVNIEEMITILENKNENNPESTDYLVKDKIIGRIIPGTTVKQLEEALNVTVNTEEDGNLKEIEDKTEIIKTGMKAKYKENDRIYELSVLGDINKDGELNQIELTKEIRNYLQIENWKITDELEKESADVRCDGVINEIDIGAIIDYIVFGNLEVPKVDKIEAPEIEIIEGIETEKENYYDSNVKVKITEKNETYKTSKTLYKIEGTNEKEETEIEQRQSEIELKENGVYKITAYSYGLYGNKSKCSTQIIVVENIQIGTANIIEEPTEWTKENVEITIEGSEGLTTEYKIDNGEWETYTDKFEVEQNCKISARITNGRKYGETVEKEITNIDKINPIVTVDTTNTQNSITATVEATDEESGIAENAEYIFYIKKANEEESSYIEKQRGTEKTYIFETLEQNTEYTIKITTTDKVGNIGTITKNVTTGSVERPGEGSYTPTDWTNTDVTVTLPTKEGYKTIYTIDGTEPTLTSTEYTLPFAVNQNCVVTYKHSDGTNLSQESRTLDISNIDKEVPTGTMTVEKITLNEIELNITAQDSNLSGIKAVRIFVNDEETARKEYNYSTQEDYEKKEEKYKLEGLTANTTYKIYMEVEDYAGNKYTNEETGLELTTFPEATIDIQTEPTDWTNGNVVAEITAPERYIEEGYVIEYQLSKEEITDETEEGWLVYDAENKITVEENTTVYARLIKTLEDGTKEKEQITSKEITNIDKVNPTISLETTSTESTITTIARATDEESGIAEDAEYIFYIKKANEEDSSYIEKQRGTEKTYIFETLEQNTEYTIKITTTDKVGNIGTITKNVTTGSVERPGEGSYTPTDWTNTDVTVTLPTKEGYKTIYTIDGTEPTLTSTEYTLPFAVNQNCVVTYKHSDGTNLSQESRTLDISNIDKEVPTGTMTVEKITLNEIELNITAQDSNLSGIKAVRIFVNDEETARKEYNYSTQEDYEKKEEKYKLEGLTANTTYKIYMEVEDYAGNKYTNEETGLELTTFPEAIIDIQSEPAEWTNGNVVTTITAPERYIEEGYVVEYQLSKEEVTDETEDGWIVYDAENKVTVEENATIYTRLIKTLEDGTKTKEQITSKEITNIDKQLPTGTISKRYAKATEIGLKVMAQDSKLSGIKAVRIFVNDEETPRKVYNYSVQKDYAQKEEIYILEGLAESTAYNVYIEVEDYAGNIYTNKETSLELSTLPQATIDIQAEPTDWTNTNVLATITVPETYIQEGYVIEYQLSKEEITDETEDGWIVYDAENEITVEENTTVYTRLIQTLEDGTKIKENIVNKAITNIDKVLPTGRIVNVETEYTQAKLNIEAQDESLAGIKEIRVYFGGNEVPQHTFTYDAKEDYELKREEVIITGLEENTRYEAYIEVEDYVGNIYSSKETPTEVVTPEHIIAARITKIGDTVISEENYTEYEYSTVTEALEHCNVEGQVYTIKILRNTEEMVEIVTGKNIIIDLAGRQLSSIGEATITNAGTLQIIDSGKTQGEGEDAITEYGQVMNSENVAINNTGTLTIGENEGGIPDKSNPRIEGTTYGIVTTSGTVNFYDGKILGNTAFNGSIRKKPTDYNLLAKIEGGKEAVYLDIIADAVARVGYDYYSSLQTAFNNAITGRYEKEPIEYERLVDLVQNNGTYYFTKNEEGKLVSNNKGIGNGIANSYIKLDLNHLEGEHTISVDASVSSESGYDIGYATISNSSTAPLYNDSTNRFIYISGSDSGTYEYTLQGGEIYYLHFGYRKDGGGNSGDDQFVINNIKLDGIENPTLYESNPILGEQVEITLVNNVTLTSAVTTTRIQNIKLDLNGYKIQTSGSIYNINNTGRLEIIDTSEEQTGVIENASYSAINNNGELIVTSGTIQVGAGTSSNYNSGIYNNLDGTVTINGGNITSEANYVRLIYNNNGKIYINNGDITTTSEYSNAIHNASSNADGLIEINGGSIIAKGHVVSNSGNSGTIQVNGGNITCTSNLNRNNAKNAIYNGGNGTINIEGGKIQGNYYVINSYLGTINITEGEIIGKSKVVSIYDGTTNILGGTIRGDYDVISSEGSGTTNIIGGNISGSGTVIVNYRGNISIENIEITGQIDNRGNMTINNSKICSDSNYAINNNGNNAKTVVKGNSEIVSNNDSSIYIAGGTLTLGEKIQEGIEEEPQSTPIIKGKLYGIRKYSENNKLNYYDGTIIGSSSYGAIYGEVNEIEKDSEIKTTIEEDKEIKTLGRVTEPVAQIGENTYDSIKDAVNSIQGLEETTITILRDISLIPPQNGTEIVEGKNIIIDLNGHKIKSVLPNMIVNRGNLTITDNKQTGSIELNLTGTNREYAVGIKNETTGTITINNNVTIINKGNYSYGIKNEQGTINSENANIECMGSYSNVVYNTGTTNIKRGSIKIEDDSSYTTTCGIMNQSGIVNIENITKVTKVTQYGSYIIKSYEGEINVTGENTLNSGSSSKFINTLKLDNSSEGTNVNIIGATINDNSTERSYEYIIDTLGKGTLTIRDSTITQIASQESNRYGVRTNCENTIIENSIIEVGSEYAISCTGNVNINNSNIINKHSSTYYSAIVLNSGTLRIMGNSNINSVNGTGINNRGGTLILGEKIQEGVIEEPQDTPIIKGGKYGITQNNTSGKLNYYDGTIIGSISYAAVSGNITEIETGYDMITTENTEEGTLKMNLRKLPIAQVGENTYYSIKEAVDAIEGTEEKTVTILRDLNLTQTGETTEIAEEKNIIIDLDGHNITSTLSNMLVNKGNLTITDNKQSGSIELNVTGTNNEYVVSIQNETTGIITVNNNVTVINKGNYSYGIKNEQGTINLENSNIECTADYSNIVYNTGTANVKGGTANIGSNSNYEKNGIMNQSGIVNIENITITKMSNDYSTGYAKYIKSYEGEINIKGENTLNSGKYSRFIETLKLNDSSEGTNINIIGATINDNNTQRGDAHIINASGKGTLAIRESIITATASQEAYRYCITTNCENTIIENSTIEVSSEYAISCTGNVNINNSNIINKHSSTYYSAIVLNSGTLRIMGNSNINSVNGTGINNRGGTLILGEKIQEGVIEEPQDTPIIKGGQYGIAQNRTSSELNYYDGTIIGTTSYAPVYGSITEMETGYDAITTENAEEGTLTMNLRKLPGAQVGENKYYSIKDAIEAIEGTEETTITILRDINLLPLQNGAEIAEGKNIIMDLDGHKITSLLPNMIVNRGNLTITDNKQTGSIELNLTGTDNQYAVGIKNEITGTMTINNNIKIYTKGLYVQAIQNQGTTNLENINLDSENSNSYVILNKSGTTNINNIKSTRYGSIGIYDYEDAGEINITGENTCENTLLYSIGTNPLNKGGKINITDAKIDSTGGLINVQSGTLTISNSTLTSDKKVIETSSYRVNGDYVKNEINIVIENSTLTSDDITISHYTKGKLNIKDSNINGTIQTDEEIILTVEGNSSIKSTGTAINSNGTTIIKGNVTVEGGTYGIRNNGSGTLTIGEDNGIIDRTSPIIIGGEYGIYNASTEGVKYYDGQIKGKTGTIYGTIGEIPSGYEINKIQDEEGYYQDLLIVSGSEISVAKIGTVRYTSLESAIQACPDSKQTTIVLENNIVASNTIEIPELKNITINLSGYTIQTESVGNLIQNNGTLQIIDNYNGQVKNTAGIAITNNGTLIIGRDEGTLRTSPTIEGTTVGIQGNATLYDGTIRGITAVSGTVTTANRYTANTQTESGIQTITLTKN